MSLCNGSMPSNFAAEKIIIDLKDYMFNRNNAKNGAISRLSNKIALHKIKNLIYRELKKCYSCACFGDFKGVEKQTAKTVSDSFIKAIPEIRALCLKDAAASVTWDPSVECESIVIATFPGFFAIMTYRIAHFFYEAGTPLLPRLMTEFAHSKTGIDINAGAKIGKNFFIDHGTGVVIGETAEIGDDCRLYQGVTLGALSIKKEERSGGKRHPTLGNNVTVYANATILGGKTVIGDDCVIGGNTFIIKSVSSGSKVVVEPTDIAR